MSRSGYSEDLDSSELAMWRGQVASAIRGKRGQALLREMLAALDAMPDKALVKHDIQDEQGAVCAIGSVAVARGLDAAQMDPYAHEELAETFNVARQMIMEIEFENDDGVYYDESPAQRWKRMRAWVVQQIKTPSGEALSKSAEK